MNKMTAVPPCEQGRQHLSDLLNRAAAEVHGLSDLARRLDEALGALTYVIDDASPTVLQEIDFLRQSLDDVTALLYHFAAETDGSIQIRAAPLRSLLQLHDLRHRLLLDGGTPPPKRSDDPPGTPLFFD